MIELNRNFDTLIKATDQCRDIMSGSDCFRVLEKPQNLMFTEGDNVGLAIYDYDKVYTVHWYFKVRGKEAISLAQDMIGNLFENYGAEVVRGLIKTRLKAARWACRKVGLKSYGFLTFLDNDENEIFFLTKTEYLEMKRNT